MICPAGLGKGVKKGSAGKDPQTGFGMRFEYGFKSPQVLDIWIKKHPPSLFSKNDKQRGVVFDPRAKQGIYIMWFCMEVKLYLMHYYY